MWGLVDELRRLFEHRVVVLCGAASGSKRLAHHLSELGASTVLDLPLPVEHGLRYWERTIQQEQLLANPPGSLAEWLDAADPRGNALVYAGSFTACQRLCGRRVVGARRTSWLRAEGRAAQMRMLRSRGSIVPVDQLRDAV